MCGEFANPAQQRKEQKVDARVKFSTKQKRGRATKHIWRVLFRKTNFARAEYETVNRAQTQNHLYLGELE